MSWKPGKWGGIQYKKTPAPPQWWGPGEVTFEGISSRALPHNMWAHIVRQTKTNDGLSITRYVVEFAISELKIQTFYAIVDLPDARAMLIEIETIVAAGILDNPERTDWASYVKNELQKTRNTIV